MPHFSVHIPKAFGLDNAVNYIKQKGLKVLHATKKVREDGDHYYFPQKNFKKEGTILAHVINTVDGHKIKHVLEMPAKALTKKIKSSVNKQ